MDDRADGFWPTVAITAITPIVWGTTYFTTTQLLPDNRPLLAGTLRALPAGLLLAAIARRCPWGRWWWKSLALGVLNIVQALVMNEAARMVEEGAATAEEIDKATRYGLGLRFAALGVVEFIDFGGADILHHASREMSASIDPARYAAPAIVGRSATERDSSSTAWP